MTISIRSITTIEECRAIERLQLDIWGPNDLEVTPDHILLTMAKEGGIVLLALNETEKPVGFIYGFLGLTEDNRLKLASHQAGVLPAYQSSGVGYQLKLAQREAALARQLDLITWTFDPLEGRNARLNMRKLGAVCNTYLCALYGEMRDQLNQGLPTDRFRVDWWITTAHVANRINGRAPEPSLSPSVCPVLNPATLLDNGLSTPADSFDLSRGDCCLVEIPADIQRLKSEAPSLALSWRLQTRQIFETAFANGYTAIDLLRREGRNYYLLQRDWQGGVRSEERRERSGERRARSEERRNCCHTHYAPRTTSLASAYLFEKDFTTGHFFKMKKNGTQMTQIKRILTDFLINLF